MTNGTLSFAEIPRLPAHWWTQPPPADPDVVWTVWDKDAYYLWGANVGNYEGIPIGASLNGGGMAGPHGPSRGRAHPHFVGVITMDFATMHLNDAVFAELATKAKAHQDVVVPIFRDPELSPTGYKLSLGTGIGHNQPDWGGIQKYLLTKIHALGQLYLGRQGTVAFPTGPGAGDGVYWPDLRMAGAPTLHPIQSLGDIENLIDHVL